MPGYQRGRAFAVVGFGFLDRGIAVCVRSGKFQLFSQVADTLKFEASGSALPVLDLETALAGAE